MPGSSPRSRKQIRPNPFSSSGRAILSATRIPCRIVRCSTAPSACAILLRRKSGLRAERSVPVETPVYAFGFLLRGLSAVTVKAADIGQADGVGNIGPAVIGAGVIVGPRRAIIIDAAIPQRIREQIEGDNGRRNFA